jgi:hypothetical protein
MMVKATNRPLVIDPFLAFHQCLMLILMSALLVVVYYNTNLLEDPRMCQGYPGMVCTKIISSDPLIWWKQKQFQFPILSCLARKYLCIPYTEAPSERIFSTASLLVSKFRNRMDPDLAGRMVLEQTPTYSLMIKNKNTNLYS